MPKDSKKTQKANQKESTNSSLVHEYLTNNNDFFTHPENRELLESIKISHYSGRSISLLEHQVQMLQEHKESLYEQLESVVEINRINQKILLVFMDLVRDMIESKELLKLVKVFGECWRDSLGIDGVSIMPEETHLHDRLRDCSKNVRIIDHDKRKLPKVIRDAARTKTVLCLEIDESTNKFFGGELKSGSFVFIPNGKDKRHCYVFLGSKDPEKFSSEMQSDMVSFICDVFCRLLYRQFEQKDI